MSCCKKFKNFLCRFLVYFVVVLWPYSRVQNLFKNADSLKSTLQRNFNINIDSNEYKETILLFFFFYSLIELIFSILGLFDIFIGHIFTMIFFILSNIIYFNPFSSGNEFRLIGMKIETFYNIGILFSIGLIAFYPRKEEKEEEEKDKEEVILEDDEMRKSMPVKKGKIK